MKGLKIAVACLTIITLGLVGYVVYKDFILKEDKTVNISEYEKKITSLEKENQQLKEEQESVQQCTDININEKYAGTYIYEGKEYSTSKDTCDSLNQAEDYTYLELTLHEDGTFEYHDATNCASGSSGSGKYVINNNTITAYNDECIEETKKYGELQNCVLVLTYKIENNQLKHSQFSRTDMKELTMTKR